MPAYYCHITNDYFMVASVPDCVNRQTLENNFLGIITLMNGLLLSNIGA